MGPGPSRLAWRLQGICVQLRHLESGLLFEAVQCKGRVCAHDVEADAIAPDFSRILGLARVSSVMVQPIAEANTGSTLAVLVAASKAPSTSLLFNEPVFDAFDECAAPTPAVRQAHARCHLRLSLPAVATGL